MVLAVPAVPLWLQSQAGNLPGFSWFQLVSAEHLLLDFGQLRQLDPWQKIFVLVNQVNHQPGVIKKKNKRGNITHKTRITLTLDMFPAVLVTVCFHGMSCLSKPGHVLDWILENARLMTPEFV